VCLIVLLLLFFVVVLFFLFLCQTDFWIGLFHYDFACND